MLSIHSKYLLNYFKPVGITPLELIEQIKTEHKKYADLTLSYAGRLDPMAEGVTLVLVEDENKNRIEYEKLDKKYEFELLRGVQTDSFDLLGLPKASNANKSIDGFTGKTKQKYPPYSSKRIRSRPLFWWAKNGKLDEIKIPSHEIQIYSAEKLSERKVNAKYINKKLKTIEKVNGDFRQKEILSAWEKFLEDKNEFDVETYELSCSSGTYIRALANDMGGTAARITRTAVGEYAIEQSLRLYEPLASRQ